MTIDWTAVIVNDNANMDFIETFADSAPSTMVTGEFLQASVHAEDGAHGVKKITTPDGMSLGHRGTNANLTFRLTDSTDVVETDVGGFLVQSVSPTGHASFNVTMECAGSAQNAPFTLEVRMGGLLKYQGIFVGKSSANIVVPITIA